MSVKKIFQRTSMEEGAFQLARPEAERLLRRTDSGLTVVGTIGARAVVGVGYEYDDGPWSYIVAERTYGIYVVAHRMAMALADCAANGCVAVNFMEGITELELYNESEELTIPRRLDIQNKACDAIDDLSATGHMPVHNPFVGEEAYDTLLSLASLHPDDELLQAIAAELPAPE